MSVMLLALLATTVTSQGAEPNAARGRMSREFGPAPENFSSLFDQELDAPLGVRPSPRRVPERTPVRVREPHPARKPVVPATAPAESLDEKITRRYRDARVLRVLTELTSSSGEAFYREISQMIDGRHIEPSTYATRIDNSFEHLAAAVENPAFQSATGIQPTPADVQSFQTRLMALRRQANPRTQADAITIMRQAGQLSQQKLGLNPAAVYFEFVYGSLDTLDKFSMFLPPEKSGSVSLGLDQQLVGIGVEIEQDPAGLRILKAFPGGPAAEATLRKGDIITAVNGRSLKGQEIGQAVELIAGPAGSSVKLSLRREHLVADVTLVRRSVQVASISEVRMMDAQAGIGYIKLDQFAESSTKELDAALWKLHQSGMQSLILDLRGNPGGYLTTAVEISDRFLPSGTIVSTRGRTADDNSQETAKYAQTWRVPLVVVIDQHSASASEILAAAIQDNGRGMIVGEKSYGKGTVQTLFPLHSVTAGLRLTTAKFFSPDGRSMAGEGVSPDIAVRTGTRDEEASMLQAALDAARDPDLALMANRMTHPNRTGLRSIEITMSAP